GRAQALGCEMEDPLLPPSDLLLGRAPWIGTRSPEGGRTAVRGERSQGGLRGARALLRAAEATEGDRLHHAGGLGQAAARQPPGQLADDCQGLRYRPVVHARGNRRRPPVLRDDLAAGRGCRFRSISAARSRRGDFYSVIAVMNYAAAGSNYAAAETASAQSASNVSRICPAATALEIRTSTSRRLASSGRREI